MFSQDSEIFKYVTCYKITNYHLGDCPKIEEDLTLYNTYANPHDTKRYKEVYYFYDEKSNVLYIPSGYNEQTLITECNHTPIKDARKYATPKTISFDMKLSPRNIVQQESIRFLYGEGEYRHTKKSSQLILSLSGGGGKTYCAISAIQKYGMSALIVCHQKLIKKQWVNRIKEYTNIKSKDILDIASSSNMNILLTQKDSKLSHYKIYIISQSLLNKFIKDNGFDKIQELMIKLGIGIKVVDEAHKYFSAMLKLDYATQVYKTIYLTATFGRSDFKEDRIYKKSFECVFKLKRGEKELGVEKKVIYIANFFHTSPTLSDLAGFVVSGRFNIMRYHDYLYRNELVLEIIYQWINWYYVKHNKSGQTFILSDKKETCEKINDYLHTQFPAISSVAYYSTCKYKSSDVMNVYKIICVTPRMIDTGVDMDDLELIINTSPFRSKINADQLIHRLIRGKDNRYRYFVDIVDKDVPNVVDSFRARSNVFSKFVMKKIEYEKNVKADSSLEENKNLDLEE